MLSVIGSTLKCLRFTNGTCTCHGVSLIQNTGHYLLNDLYCLIDIIYIHTISKIQDRKIVLIAFLSLQVTVKSLVTTYLPVWKNLFWLNRLVDSPAFF